MKFLFIKKLLIPKGEIHTKYLNYMYWSAFSNFLISIESVLSTHSMLSTLSDNTSSQNLSLNYISKDIIGQSFGLFVMNYVSKYIDSNPNKFLKHSLIFQQGATILECTTPLFPLSLFIPIGAISNICKGISFIGIGGINAKIINKLSINGDNIGEIYTKATIINTISTSIGMMLGLMITIYIPCHQSRLCFLPLLGVMRYYSFYKSINGIL